MTGLKAWRNWSNSSSNLLFRNTPWTAVGQRWTLHERCGVDGSPCACCLLVVPQCLVDCPRQDLFVGVWHDLEGRAFQPEPAECQRGLVVKTCRSGVRHDSKAAVVLHCSVVEDPDHALTTTGKDLSQLQCIH